MNYEHSFLCILDDKCYHAKCGNCKLRFSHNEISARDQFLRVTEEGLWVIDVLRRILNSIWSRQGQEPEGEEISIQRRPVGGNVRIEEDYV